MISEIFNFSTSSFFSIIVANKLMARLVRLRTASAIRGSYIDSASISGVGVMDRKVTTASNNNNTSTTTTTVPFGLQWRTSQSLLNYYYYYTTNKYITSTTDTITTTATTFIKFDQLLQQTQPNIITNLLQKQLQLQPQLDLNECRHNKERKSNNNKHIEISIVAVLISWTKTKLHDLSTFVTQLRPQVNNHNNNNNRNNNYRYEEFFPIRSFRLWLISHSSYLLSSLSLSLSVHQHNNQVRSFGTLIASGNRMHPCIKVARKSSITTSSLIENKNEQVFRHGLETIPVSFRSLCTVKV